MFIGKWNKSIIITYLGGLLSIIGIYLAIRNEIKYAFILLIIAGVCDLFDGKIARNMKRTEEEKNFGIQIDSLVDVINFLCLPIVIFISIGLNEWYHLVLFCFYGIFGVVRLGYFNIILENNNKPVPYYKGLPVTFAALIFPIFYLVGEVFPNSIFTIFYTIIIILVTLLFILNIKIKKPHGIAYPILAIMAIVAIIIYSIVL